MTRYYLIKNVNLLRNVEQVLYARARMTVTAIIMSEEILYLIICRRTYAVSSFVSHFGKDYRYNWIQTRLAVYFVVAVAASPDAEFCKNRRCLLNCLLYFWKNVKLLVANVLTELLSLYLWFRIENNLA